MLQRSNLHRYQSEQMVPHILQHPKNALFVDMGLGKTIATLTALSDLFNEFEIGKVLITGPLRVANTVWHQEIQDWAHTMGMKSVICTGTRDERIAALDSEADIHIINYENLWWLRNEYRGRPGFRKSKIRQWKWDMVVIDESTSVKNPDAKRHRAIKHMLGHIDRMVLLTGSPAANGLQDLWGQIYLLDQGERLGRTKGDFIKRYFDYNPYSHELTPHDWAEEAIFKKISDICLVLEAKDHLDLPETVNNTIRVDLPPKLRAQYDKLEEEYYVKLEQMDLNDEVIALSGAALSTKLLQFANGAVYTEGGKLKKGDDKWTGLHDEKIDALKEITSEAQGHPVLIAYNFKSDLAKLKKAFPKSEMLTKDNKEKWNQQKIPQLLVHPASGGHGLNLQKGSHITAWMGCPWSLEHYEQLNARLGPVRQKQSGTGKVPIVHHVITRNTVDEVVMSRLASKESLQNALKSALKAYKSGTCT